jgi:hypothetical protein
MGVTGSSLHVCWPQCLFQGFPKIVAGRKDLKPAEPSKGSDLKKKNKKKTFESDEKAPKENSIACDDDVIRE